MNASNSNVTIKRNLKQIQRPLNNISNFDLTQKVKKLQKRQSKKRMEIKPFFIHDILFKKVNPVHSFYVKFGDGNILHNLEHRLAAIGDFKNNKECHNKYWVS